MSVNGPLGATPQTGAFELTPRAHARTPSARSRMGLAGLSGVVLMGLVLSVSAAHTDSLLPESVRPVPGWLAGPFGAAGAGLSVGALLSVLVLMFASYAVAINVADRLSARHVLMAIAALHAVVLLAPPLLSTDVFSYQAYARMLATYGTNPYLHGPHAIALDPLYPFIGAKWISTPSAYGPLFTAFSYVLAPLSIAASALAYKAIATLASLATVTLLWQAARLRGLDPVRSVALFGLNPLIVIYGVGGGHNDLLMLTATTAAIYFLLAHRERTSGALVVVGSAIKLTAGLLLPFFIASGVELGARKRRREILLGAAAAAAAIATMSFAVFGSAPLHLINTLQRVQAEGDWHSVPGFITNRLGLGAVGHVTGIALGVVFVVAFLWLLRRVWRGEMDWIDGAAWATVVMLVTASSLLPWYVAWLIPLVALCTDRRLWLAAIALTGVIQTSAMLDYLPHGSKLLGLLI